MTSDETTTTEEPPVEGAPEAAAAEEAAEPSWEETLEDRIDEALGAKAAAEEGDDAETEPPEGEEAEAEAPEAGAGEEPAEEEAAEEDATEEGAEAGDPDADAGDSLVLRLPGRNEDDDDIEIPLTAEQLEAAGIDAQAFTERQNQLRNGYMRGQEVRAAKEDIRSERQELDFIASELAERPSEFIGQHVHPSHYPDAIRTMLVQLDDDAYEGVLTEIAELDGDKGKRKEARLDARQKEIDRKAERQQRTASSDYVKEVRTKITGLVPDDMDDAKADEFFDFAIMKLERYAKQNPRTRIEPDQVPALLRELGALDPYGLTAEADARTDDSLPSKGARRQDRPATGEPDGKAKRTGKDLKARADARKKAAAVTPAGSGSANNAGLRARTKGLSTMEKLTEIAKSSVRMG